MALARRRSVREYAEDPLTQAEIGRLLWAADLRVPLGTVALGQVWLSRAPAVFVISGDVSRTAVKYGVRAERHALMQAGHAAQNLLVQAVALGLAATPVDAFEDDSVTRLRRPRS